MVLSYCVAIAQKSLSFAKKFFDQMPCLVKFLVVGAWLSAFRTCRDNGRFAHAPKRFQDTGLGIETLIGDHRFGPKRRKQNIGAIQLGSLSSRSDARRSDCPARPRSRESWCSAHLCCVRGITRRHFIARPGCVLVITHNGCVDHGVLVIRVLHQMIQHLLLYAALCPAHKPRVHHAKIAESLGKVAPQYPRTVAVQNRLHKQTVISCRTTLFLTIAGWERFSGFPAAPSATRPARESRRQAKRSVRSRATEVAAPHSGSDARCCRRIPGSVPWSGACR